MTPPAVLLHFADASPSATLQNKGDAQNIADFHPLKVGVLMICPTIMLWKSTIINFQLIANCLYTILNVTHFSRENTQCKHICLQTNVQERIKLEGVWNSGVMEQNQELMLSCITIISVLPPSYRFLVGTWERIFSVSNSRTPSKKRPDWPPLYCPSINKWRPFSSLLSDWLVEVFKWNHLYFVASKTVFSNDIT